MPDPTPPPPPPSRAASTPAARAAQLVRAVEAAGKVVQAVELDGRKIRVILVGANPDDEVSQCDAAFGVRR